MYILSKVWKNGAQERRLCLIYFAENAQILENCAVGSYLEQKSREKCIIVKFLAQLSMNAVTYYIKRGRSNGIEIRVA